MQKIIQAEGTQQTLEDFVNQVKSMEKADAHVLFFVSHRDFLSNNMTSQLAWASNRQSNETRKCM